MPQKIKQHKGVFSTILNTFSSINSYPQIAIPYLILAFIQLLLLEILFFAPRFPLNLFFGPLIRKLWGDIYLHYPWNLVLLPRLFQAFQIPLFIFISSFFIAVSIRILNDINEGKKVDMRSAFRRTFKSYVHILIAAGITFTLVWVFYKIFNLIYARATVIGATGGIKFFIKAVILYGAPYFNLFLGAFATACTAFILPAIIIDKKGIFAAAINNFRILKNNFLLTLGLVFTSYLLFAPALLLRQLIGSKILPLEASVWVMILSVVLTVSIDAVVYTSLATVYILNKEDK